MIIYIVVAKSPVYHRTGSVSGHLHQWVSARSNDGNRNDSR